jgi:hypothetical protein
MLKPLDPRFRSYELSISRHGALNVFKTVPQTDVAAGSTASQSSYTIRLPLNCPEQLRRGVFFHLDFGMDAREADEWYLALSLMIEPWYVILAKTDGSVVDDLIKLGLATITAPASTAPGASAHGYTAQEYSQPNDSARKFLEAAKQTAEGVAGLRHLSRWSKYRNRLSMACSQKYLWSAPVSTFLPLACRSRPRCISIC